MTLRTTVKSPHQHFGVQRGFKFYDSCEISFSAITPSLFKDLGRHDKDEARMLDIFY